MNPKILIGFEDGKTIVTIEKGTSLAELVLASFELQRKALFMSIEKSTAFVFLFLASLPKFCY